MLLITYSLIKILPRQKAPKVVFIYTFTHLSFVHLYIMYCCYGYWGADLTAYLMILSLKMTSLAYLYRDGDPKVKHTLSHG